MKKILIIILSIVSLLVIGFISLFLFLNREKESITADRFVTTMQEKDFEIADIKNQLIEYDFITQAYVAAPQDQSYTIEFYEFSDIESAVSFYNNNKSILSESKGENYGATNISLSNYSKYTLSTNEKYSTVSRIDNTAIYVNTKIESKRDVKELLDELGY